MYNNNEELMVFLNRRKFESQSNRLVYDKEIMDGYKYYWGFEPKPFANGGSGVVDRFVYDQTLGMISQLKDTLVTDNKVVRFTPLNASMGRAAKEATYHINREIIQGNDGINLLTTAIHTALLNKCAYLQPYWVNSTKDEEVYFDNLTPDAVAMMAMEMDEVIIESEDEETGLQSGKAIKIVDNSYLKIDTIPFEHVYIEPSADSFDSANYICRKITKLRSEFEEEGIVIPDDAVLDESDNDTLFNHVRSEYMNIEMLENRLDEGTSYVSLYLHYARMEHKGKYGLWCFLTSLYTVISEELVEMTPIAQIQPLPNPLAIYGESLPDITKDVQIMKTFILRGLFDNIMDSNHPTVLAMRNQVDIRQLMNKKPNRIILADSPNSVTFFKNQPLTNEVSLANQIIQQMGDTRTGLSNAAQGLSDSVFKNDNAYATVEAVINQALQRTKNIASNIVNGGFTKLMILCYHIARTNDTKVYETNIDGRPITYSPSNWPEVMDISVDASISPVDKAARLAKLKEVNALIASSPLVQQMQLFGPEQQFQLLIDQIKSMNIDNVNDYVLPLEMGQPVQPDPMTTAEKETNIGVLKSTIAVNEANAQKAAAQAQDIARKAQFDEEVKADEETRANQEFAYKQERDGVLDAFQERSLLQKDKELWIKEEEIRAEAYLEKTQRRGVGLGN